MGIALFRGLKGRKADASRCAFHYYRPMLTLCPACRTPICRECSEETDVGLCPSCIANPLAQEEIEGQTRKAKKPNKARYGKKAKAVAGARQDPNKTVKIVFRKRLDRRRLARVAVAVLAPIFVAMMILTLTGRNPFFGARPPVLSAAEREGQLRGFLLFAVNGIDAYQKRSGKAPADLGQIGILDLENWEYEVRPDGSYKIAAKDGDLRLYYDSTLDRSKFFAAAPQGGGPGSGK